MYSQIGYTRLAILILIVHLYINQGTADHYNPFTKLRTGRRLNDDDSDAITTLPHLFSNDENLKFSTTSKPAIDASASNRLIHFDTLFNNESLFNQTSSLNQSSNRPRIRSANNELINPKQRSSVDDGAVLEKRQNGPFVEDIYGSLLHLLSGNMQLNRSPGNQPMNSQLFQFQQLLNKNPQFKAYLMKNPNLLHNNLLNQLSNRVNSRLPAGLPLNNIPNLPNGFIIGPSNRPPSLPLHFPKLQQPSSNRPTVSAQSTNGSPGNSNAQQQFNNQFLNQLFKPGASQLNLTSLPINNILPNMINNQTFDPISFGNALNANASKSYIRIGEAEVSRLLLGPGSSRPIRNEIVFGSTSATSSSDDSSFSIDSPHYPNELFARTSINRTLNENSNTNSLNANRPINLAKPAEIFATKTLDKIENLFELTNATVIRNNHYDNRFPFNRTQLTSSFSTIISPSIDDASTTVGTVQLNTKHLLNSLNLLANSETTTSTSIWKPFDKFEMFNTNNNLIKPTRTAWGNPPDIITKPEEASTFDITVRNKMGANETKVDLLSENVKATLVAGLHESSSTSKAPEAEVVYGRPANRQNNNNNYLPGLMNSVNPSTTQTIVNSVSATLNSAQRSTPSLPSTVVHDSLGRPIIYPVEMDLVKPQVATNSNNQLSSSVSIITESGGGSVYIDAQQKHFKLKPIQKTSTIPSMQIGSTMNVYGNGNNLESRKPGSSLSNANPINPFTSLNTTNVANEKPRVNQVRRPTFRPKPATPLVRIDTCIVGDDSTCGANLNEHCKTEAGISSCQCKPGFGRSTLRERGVCIPTTSLVISLKLDKLGENKLQFNKNLLNVDSEDFQYLEFEAIQAINSLFQNSRLNKLFLGVRVNKFYPVQSKTMLNATVVLERNNVTKSNSIKKQLQQELSRVISAKNNALGDSPLLVDSVALPRLDDVNECADPNLNDCSRNARCINELGTFSCVCKPGFEDRYALSQSSSYASSSALTSANSGQNRNLVMKLGRICLGCSPAYCSGRGDCSIQNGEKVCHCKGNFMGSRCDLDAEVLAVAFGGSLAALIIIIITILCLYIWNQKWKNEQQKMEAMSSGSGQTSFNYVNKPANATSFRFGMEERMREWNPAFEATTLQNNASNYNYYVNPEQILVSTSQHVYATPSREEIVHTPDQLLDDDSNQHFYNTRRSKTRNCTLAYQPAGIYNETEFSARKTLYAPSHLIMGTARPKYSLY